MKKNNRRKKYLKPRNNRKRHVANTLLEEWVDNISDGIEIREEWEKMFKVEMLEQMYLGFQEPENWENEWVTINLMAANGKILLRNVVPKDIQVKIEVDRISDPGQLQQIMQSRKVRQVFLQQLINSQKLYQIARLVYVTSLARFGVFKVGHTSIMETNKKAGMVVKNKKGEVERDKDGEIKIEGKKKVKSEQFFIDCIHPSKIIIDPTCEQISDSGWFAEEINTTISELKGNPLYKKVDFKELERYSNNRKDGDILNRPFGNSYGNNKKREVQNSKDSITVYEIYDLVNKRMLIITEGYDKILVNREMPKGILDHPYVFFITNLHPRNPYGVPTLHNWEGPQREYCKVRNQYLSQAKNSNRKYVTKEGALRPEEQAKLQDGEDGTILQTDAPIVPLKDPPAAPSLYNNSAMLRQEFDQMSSVGSQQRGVADSDSATEAEIINARSREGEAFDHTIMMESLELLIQKLHFLVQENIKTSGCVLSNENPYKEWISYGPQDFDPIDGSFTFSVIAEEVLKNTMQVEKAQMLQFMDMIGKNPALALVPSLMDSLLSKFSAIKNNEKLLQELQAYAQLMLQMQVQMAVNKQGQGGGGAQKPKKAETTKKSASNSRKVASK